MDKIHFFFSNTEYVLLNRSLNKESSNKNGFFCVILPLILNNIKYHKFVHRLFFFLATFNSSHAFTIVKYFKINNFNINVDFTSIAIMIICCFENMTIIKDTCTPLERKFWSACTLTNTGFHFLFCSVKFFFFFWHLRNSYLNIFSWICGLESSILSA